MGHSTHSMMWSSAVFQVDLAPSPLLDLVDISTELLNIVYCIPVLQLWWPPLSFLSSIPDSAFVSTDFMALCKCCYYYYYRCSFLLNVDVSSRYCVLWCRQCLKKTNTCRVRSLRLRRLQWFLRKRNKQKREQYHRRFLNCVNIARNMSLLLTR